MWSVLLILYYKKHKTISLNLFKIANGYNAEDVKAKILFEEHETVTLHSILELTFNLVSIIVDNVIVNFSKTSKYKAT